MKRAVLNGALVLVAGLALAACSENRAGNFPAKEVKAADTSQALKTDEVVDKTDHAKVLLRSPNAYEITLKVTNDVSQALEIENRVFSKGAIVEMTAEQRAESADVTCALVPGRADLKLAVGSSYSLNLDEKAGLLEKGQLFALQCSRAGNGPLAVSDIDAALGDLMKISLK
jgi:hypothetical protein